MKRPYVSDQGSTFRSLPSRRPRRSSSLSTILIYSLVCSPCSIFSLKCKTCQDVYGQRLLTFLYFRFSWVFVTRDSFKTNWTSWRDKEVVFVQQVHRPGHFSVDEFYVYLGIIHDIYLFCCFSTFFVSFVYYISFVGGLFISVSLFLTLVCKIILHRL